MESTRRRCKTTLASSDNNVSIHSRLFQKKEIKSLSLPLFFLIRKLSSWGLRGSLYLATPLKPEDCSVTRRTRRKVPLRVSLKVTLLFSPEGPSALAPTLRAWQGRMPCRSSYLFIINIRKGPVLGECPKIEKHCAAFEK